MPSLTLWCSLTMLTRLRWNSLRRSSSRDTDRCGRPSTFSSAGRDTSVTHSTTPEGHKPREPREVWDQSPAMELSHCQDILPLVPNLFPTSNELCLMDQAESIPMDSGTTQH